jgi:hypothetical protein
MSASPDSGLGIRQQYRAVLDALLQHLASTGFSLRGRETFFRTRKGVQQNLTVSLREPPGEDVGFVEVYPGFNFPEVEALAASLQGKKPRAGFITCSLNIGLLSPKATQAEWPLHTNEDFRPTAHVAIQSVVDFAAPFWDEFSSLQELSHGFDSMDPRLCRGSVWPWRQIAATSLSGHSDRAIELLKSRRGSGPDFKDIVVDAALKHLGA